MGVTRRGFLGVLSVAGAVGAVAATSPAAAADAFTYRGWQIHWSGWREPPNQLLIIGYWSASCGERDAIVAATSTGTVGDYHPCYTLDCTIEHGWPALMPWSTAEERAAVRERAWQALREELDRRT